jgi:aspartate carbamoyltransferase catalytic subunit
MPEASLPKIDGDFRGRSLISVGQLDRPSLDVLMLEADAHERSLEREMKKMRSLAGNTVVIMATEPSTVITSSFELAARRLSADVMTIRSAGSAEPEESLKEAMQTLKAYEPDIVVVRDPAVEEITEIAQEYPAPIIYAGSRTPVNADPTQAIAELREISNHTGSIDGLKLTVVGDPEKFPAARALAKLVALHNDVEVQYVQPTEEFEGGESEREVLYLTDLERALYPDLDDWLTVHGLIDFYQTNSRGIDRPHEGSIVIEGGSLEAMVRTNLVTRMAVMTLITGKSVQV